MGCHAMIVSLDCVDCLCGDNRVTALNRRLTCCPGSVQVSSFLISSMTIAGGENNVHKEHCRIYPLFPYG